MASPHPKHFTQYLNKMSVFLILMGSMVWLSCSHNKKVYKSDCDSDKAFKHVGFSQLIDSLANYDQKYVEVSGRYKEDKGVSALFNDSLFVDHSSKNALWVDFSQDCPLYLLGTHVGLFEYNDGKFTQINDKLITIRGRIDLHNKGHLKQYRGTIERVSFIKL